jgi:hypothetical protein
VGTRGRTSGGGSRRSRPGSRGRRRAGAPAEEAGQAASRCIGWVAVDRRAHADGRNTRGGYLHGGSAQVVGEAIGAPAGEAPCVHHRGGGGPAGEAGRPVRIRIRISERKEKGGGKEG